MFTIDLLKGRAVPIKSGPEGVAVAATTFAVPTIIAIIMFSCYLHTRIVVSIQKQKVANYEAKTKELSKAVELQRTFEKEKKNINSCLSEAQAATGNHIQWSPILVTLVENMPDSVILTNLGVKQQPVRKKVPQKDDPTKTIDVTISARTLEMSVSGHSHHNCDEDVRTFQDRLRFSALLGPKLEDIIISQKSDKLKDEEVVSYKIDCIFKPEL